MSFVPCLAADEEEKRLENRRQEYVKGILVAAAGVLVLLYVPSAIRKKILKLADELSDASSNRSLRHHFTKEQVNRVKQWRASGELSVKNNQQLLDDSSDIRIFNILDTAIRHNDDDITDRVIDLIIEHDIRSYFGSGWYDLLIKLAERGRFDAFHRLLVRAEMDDLFLFSDFEPVMKAAIKHDHLDTFNNLLEVTSKRENMFANHQTEQIVAFAVEHGVRLNTTTYSAVLENAAESGSFIHATRLLDLADEGGFKLDQELVGRVLEKIGKTKPSSFFDFLFLEEAGGFQRYFDRHFGEGEYQRRFAWGQQGDYHWHRDNPFDDKNYDVADLYRTLEVKEDASPKEIKKAYRLLMKKYHPDKNSGDKAAEEKAKKIIDAYATLQLLGKLD